MTIGWAPKKNRDGQPTPGCWITDGGYTVAEFLVYDQQVYAVTAPGDSVAITDHMAGLAVAKFEGESA